MGSTLESDVLSDVDVEPFLRLLETVSNGEISHVTAGILVFQLVGGVERTVGIGADKTGDIHAAIISDVSVNNSGIANRVMDMDPNAVHLNGGHTTKGGAIVSGAGDDLTKGPVLDDDVNLVCIESFTQLASEDQLAFTQILNSSTYSICTKNIQEKLPATGPLLFLSHPDSGTLDPLSSYSNQIGIEPVVRGSVDIVIPENTLAADVESPDSETVLTKEEVETVLAEAKAVTPQWTRTASSYLEEQGRELHDEHEIDFEPDIPNRQGMEEVLLKFSEAYARLRLDPDSNSEMDVEKQDIDVAAAFLGEIYSRFAQALWEDVQEDEDDQSANTGTSKSQRDRIKNLKQLIADIEETDPEGAHIDAIQDRASKLDMNKIEVDKEIEKLKQKGEVYEPSDDYLRTT